MRAIAAMFFGGLVALSSANGCALKHEDEATRFRGAIPQSSDVALSVPRSATGTSGTTTTKSLHTKGGDAEGTAKFYRFTRDMADGVDVGTAEILGLVWVIVHLPPTHV